VPGLDIVELLGVENVLPIMGQERRYCGDDSRPIRTGERQNELVIGHGSRDESLGGTFGDDAPLLYHRQSPCANPASGVMMNKERAVRLRDHG
jgi:hypothetical protein